MLLPFFHMDGFGIKLPRISLNRLVTVVEGGPKAPFSIATTPSCRGERYSFPWIAPLYPWSLPYNAECQARKHQVTFFLVFCMARPRIELGSPGPLANTLIIMPKETKPVKMLLKRNSLKLFDFPRWSFGIISSRFIFISIYFLSYHVWT